jgi:hypothetical protein
MPNGDLGANEFTFAGDRTHITYDTQTPVPGQGPLFQYQGPEGDYTFTGTQVIEQDSSLGTLLTVGLTQDAGAGAINITVLVPKAYGVTPDSPVAFSTIAVKTTGRGFIETPGVALTYDLLPLLGTASQVFRP